MNLLLQHSAGLFFHPRRTFRGLLEGNRRAGYGIFGALILALVYFAGISTKMALNAMHIPAFLVINIPPEQYYAYERFFLFPAGLAGTILAAGAIRLCARGWQGQGTFEDLFALLGFSMIEIAVVMGLPDLVQGILIGRKVIPPVRWTDVWPHVYLGTVWFLLLMILAVREAERLGWKKSILLGLVGFAVSGGVQSMIMR